MSDLPPLIAHALELAILVVLTSISLGVGLRFLRLMRLESRLSLGERALFGVALGYGALSFSMLALGLLGIIQLPVALVVLAALAVAGYGPLLQEAPRLARRVRGSLVSIRFAPNAFLSVIIAACLGAALLKVLVPVATQDDLMYHLELPSRYIESGAILFFPDSTYSLFPQLLEMLYTWGLLLGSDRISVLFAFAASLLGPLAGALFAGRYLAPSKEGIWRALPILVIAIFFSIGLVGYVMRAANTDLAQAGFDFLAVYAFWLFWTRDEGPRTDGVPAGGDANSVSIIQHPKWSGFLLLSGLMCGLSFSTKYYGFAIGLSLGAALVARLAWRAWRERGRNFGEFIRPVLIFGAGTALLAAPWLIRNVVSAGNPVWPLAGSIFGGAYWSPEASPEELLGSAPPFDIANLWTGLEYMWVATTRDQILIDKQFHPVNLGYAALPMLLLLPFARWKSAVAWLAYGAGAYWLMWAFYFSRTSARYLSTFLLFAAVLAAFAVVSACARFRIGRWLAGTVVALSITVQTALLAASAIPHAPAVLTFDPAEETKYLYTYMADYPMLDYIRAETPHESRIYIWDGQPRGYYMPRSYVYARLVPLYTNFAMEPERWRARLKQLGMTHVLYHSRDFLAPGQEMGKDEDIEAGRRFAERYLTPPLFSINNFTLYALK